MTSFEASKIAAAARDAEYRAKLADIVATTKCSRCKALPGQPCEWGVTNTSNVHTPRWTRYSK